MCRLNRVIVESFPAAWGVLV